MAGPPPAVGGHAAAERAPPRAAGQGLAAAHAGMHISRVTCACACIARICSLTHPYLQVVEALRWVLQAVPLLCCPAGRAEHVLSRADESARSEVVRLAGGRRGRRERQAQQEETPAERQRAYKLGLEQIEAVAQRRLVRHRAVLQRWEEEEERQRQRALEWEETQRQWAQERAARVQAQARARQEQEQERQKVEERQRQKAQEAQERQRQKAQEVQEAQEAQVLGQAERERARQSRQVPQERAQWAQQAQVLVPQERAQEQAQVLVQEEKLTLRKANSTTGYIGVYLNAPGKSKPYQAKVSLHHKDVYLGSFATAEEAALCIARSPEGRLAATREAEVERAAAALTSEEEEKLATKRAKKTASKKAERERKRVREAS